MLFLKDYNELCSAFNILQNFGEVAGLRLNLKKCEGLRLGVKHHTPITIAKSFEIKWPQGLKYLGIFISNEDDIMRSLIWDDKQRKRVISNWKNPGH